MRVGCANGSHSHSAASTYACRTSRRSPDGDPPHFRLCQGFFCEVEGGRCRPTLSLFDDMDVASEPAALAGCSSRKGGQRCVSVFVCVCACLYACGGRLAGLKGRVSFYGTPVVDGGQEGRRDLTLRGLLSPLSLA